MSLAGRVLLAAVVVGICSLATASAGMTAGFSGDAAEEGKVRVFTDGRLRVGHLETIRVAGFPGRGTTEISFFPAAICEDGCGARSYRGGRTNASGAARFELRIPGTFFDHRDRPTYFRDGERIEVNVVWNGPDHSFAAGSASPRPVLVRTKGAKGG